MNYTHSFRSLTGLGALLFALGCIASGDEVYATDDTIAPDEANLGTAANEIVDGQPAQAWMQQRAVSISTGCTGTIISDTHILTAAHCAPVVGSTTVQFYNNSTIPSGPRVGLTRVSFRPGVNPFDDDLTDVNGDFADIAILTLAQRIPATSAKSPLAIFYPGSDGSGIQVGRGRHDGISNPNSVLRWAFNGLYSDDNSDGYFYTNDDRVNPGDSGGPIYTHGELQGTLWGHWWVAFATRNKYTAVSYYLPWILSTIGYTGSFSHTYQNLVLSGNTIETIATSDLNTCKLACMQNSSCFGYSFQPLPPLYYSLCTLRSDDVGADLPWPGAISGIR
ncbi:trypsin-like serine protease [Sorangium sp. So ce429]